MLARCSRCQKTFYTDRFGRQRCTSCGAEVDIADPSGAPPAAPLPGPIDVYAPPAAQVSGLPPLDGPPGQSIPWERRRELGWWPALTQTLSATFSDPTNFFRRMRYDHVEGAHLYFLITFVLPLMLGSLLSSFGSGGQITPDQREAFDKLATTPQAKQIMDMVLSQSQNLGAAVIFFNLISIPIFSFIGFYFAAAGTHLVLLALGKAGGGWTATLKVFLYSGGVGVLNVLPYCCGLIIATFWSVILQIVGLAPAHKTTGAFAAAGVIGFHLVLLLCCCGGPIFFVASMAAAGGAAP